MNFIQILIFISISLLFRYFRAKQWFYLVLLVASLSVIFWLQPISTIRTLDFWFPAISIMLGCVTWLLIVKREDVIQRDNLRTGIVVFLFILFIGLTRFFPQLNIQKQISIPNIFKIISFLIIFGIVLFIVNTVENQRVILWGVIVCIIIIFIVIKNELLSLYLSMVLRELNNQSINLAVANEIVWVGYSYFSFRIIHALIESKKRNGISISLINYLIYLFYFPSFLAGPIEKLENFHKELITNKYSTENDLLIAGERIAIGLFQKFIIADTIAIISINNSLSQSITSVLWMWVVVLAYSFRIYFDFSGYTNIALGISMILGIKLPENFNKPLRSPTLAIFWTNWHMTLTQWFRAYYFNPLTRYLKTKFRNTQQQLLMGFMQITTMLLIGLWHGINLNFIAWGAWNGLGLFIQNKISAFLMQKLGKGKPFWQISKYTQDVSILITFIFISLGWVWFALPTLDSSLQVYKVLFGRA